MSVAQIATAGRGEARVALDAVLASHLFARSPRSALLLSYLCSKYFSGHAQEIKEYNIAIDVLGRSIDFDPSVDASARVEIHRLRKKLRDYYESDGRLQPVQIQLPSGSYVPQFVRMDAVATSTASEAHESVAAEAPSRAATRVITRWLPWIMVAVSVAALAVFVVRKERPSDTARASAPAPREEGLIGPAPGTAVRILAGRRRELTDRLGRVWEADRYFKGGEAFEQPLAQVARASDPTPYQGGRTGDFVYEIPIEKGPYELRLHFVETTYGPGMLGGGGENSRVFHVALNDERILGDFDIVSDANGPGIAEIRVFKDVLPAKDGRLHLRFIGARGKALVNAIELVPSHKGRMNPIRLTMLPRTVTDSLGQLWQPDDYWQGGQHGTHEYPVTGSADQGLFERERYGHFSYALPVAAGTYSLRLYLAEKHFGPENGGGGGAGSRVFDVFCNGVALEKDLDVYRRVGANRALVARYDGLMPNAQGKLELSFAPSRNYASLYAIAVDDISDRESRQSR